MTILKRAPSLSLVEIAYDSITTAIIDQQFKPGSALNIDKIARSLEMSNTPIREALARANSEGLVVQVSNKGYSVSRFLSEKDYQHLFDTRVLLEGYAVSHIQQVDLIALSGIVEQMTAAKNGRVYNDYREYIDYDRQFHSIIIDGANNSYISHAWRDLNCHLHQNRLRLYDTNGSFDQNDATQEHISILDRLKANDFHSAAEVMVNHLRSTQQRILPLLEKIEIEPVSKME